MQIRETIHDSHGLRGSASTPFDSASMPAEIAGSAMPHFPGSKPAQKLKRGGNLLPVAENTNSIKTNKDPASATPRTSVSALPPILPIQSGALGADMVNAKVVDKDKTTLAPSR